MTKTMLRWIAPPLAVLTLTLLALAAAVALTADGSAGVSAQGPTRTVALDDDWNLVSWSGPATAVEDALEAILSRVGSAHTFNNASKQFRNFSPTGPAFVNSLQTFNPGDAVWIRMSRSASWVQPLAPVTITAALTTGFNLVPWFGPDGMAVDEATAGIGGALTGIFAFDPSDQAFDTFGPSNPAFLNSLGVLPFGVGLWVQVTRSATWSQPASGLGGEATTLDFPSLGLTVEIPAGALPPGVSPDDIVATNAKTSNTSFTQEGTPIQIDGWPVLSAVTLEPAGLTFLQPVTVSLTVPDGPGGTPFALPLTNRIGDAVVDVRTDVAADGSAVVSWQTTQSGTFAALEASIDFSPTDIGSVAAGVPFTVDVTVDISGAIPTVDVGGDSGVVPLAIEAASLSGTFSAPAGVTPPSVTAPASTPIAFDPPSNTVYSGDFTCSTPGPFEIVYAFSLDWGINLVLPAPFLPVSLFSGTYRGSVAIPGICE